MIEHIRHKVRQLYLFLKEANQLRFPPVRHVSQHPRGDSTWPTRRTIRACRSIGPARNDGAQVADDCLLRIARPMSTPCPPPPFNVSNWLLPDWDDPTKAAYFAATRNVAAADSAAAHHSLRRRRAAPGGFRSVGRAARGVGGHGAGRAQGAGVFRAVLRDSFRHRARRRAARAGRRGWPAQLAGGLVDRRQRADRSSGAAQARGTALRRQRRRIQHSRDGSADRAVQRAVRGPAEHRGRVVAQSDCGAGKRRPPSVGRRRHGELSEDAGADAVAHQRPAVQGARSPTSLPTRRECGAIRC